MRIEKGKGQSEYGPGVSVQLNGKELARAVMAYLVARGVHVSGPQTISVNGVLCRDAATEIYVDPSGFVIDKKGTKFDGRGSVVGFEDGLD